MDIEEMRKAVAERDESEAAALYKKLMEQSAVAMRARLADLGISPEKAAKGALCTGATFRAAVNGRGNTSVKTLARILTALGLTADLIITVAKDS
ncbi:hypothetical protein LCGC14_1742420 [marine sediment metagenome]|uniref:HTH cro/C1-type domain-containing protein n=1 Tax=marine sediment metagenome TaxID=412755 RepID=A0A0F9H678_9ZZZZ